MIEENPITLFSDLVLPSGKSKFFDKPVKSGRFASTLPIFLLSSSQTSTCLCFLSLQ